MAEQLVATIIRVAAAINTTSPVSSSAIEVAGRNHRFWFFMYIAWIVVAAVVSAIFTGMLWRAGNRQQDSVIAETNERTQKLEGDVAVAKTKQAEAERTLLEIQQRFTPRTLIGEQRDKFVAQLADSPKGKVEISVTTGDPEAYTFAAQLWNALKDAGFDVGTQVVSFTMFGPPPVGVILGVKDKDKQPPYGGEIQKALKSVGIDAGGELFGAEDGAVYVRVGIKPSQ
jgi:mannitol-specific phosphotransferase system IIBC component